MVVSQSEIDKAKALLEEEPKISTREIAKRVGVGYVRFSHAFKEQEGMTMAHYRAIYRDQVRKASAKKDSRKGPRPETIARFAAVKKDLRETRLTRTEIAKRHGFTCVDSMWVRFRRLYGLSALTYRRQVWGVTQKQEGPRPETIARFEAVKKDLRETRLTKVEIAERHGFASAHSMGERFRKVFGQSAQAYRRQVWAEHGELPEQEDQRLSAAQEFLRSTSWKIHKVAHRSGFPSEKSMRTIFQRAVGMSPSEYRMRHHLPAIQEALMEEGADIVAIGKSFGFYIDSGWHFKREFEKLTGIRPRDFREIMRKRQLGNIVHAVSAHQRDLVPDPPVG